jgi:hypothetical protein
MFTYNGDDSIVLQVIDPTDGSFIEGFRYNLPKEDSVILKSGNMINDDTLCAYYDNSGVDHYGAFIMVSTLTHYLL